MNDEIIYKTNNSKPWLARIDVENYPNIDPDSEDGKETLTGYAAMINFHNPVVTHIIIARDGEPIGEVAIGRSPIEPETLH